MKTFVSKVLWPIVVMALLATVMIAIVVYLIPR
jgi:hypothetical protein